MDGSGRTSGTLARSGNPATLPVRVLAKRKPLLLFRFVGVFLLRLAERRFCGLLFQEPPRRTREGAGQEWRRRTRVRAAEHGRTYSEAIFAIAYDVAPIPKSERPGLRPG